MASRSRGQRGQLGSRSQEKGVGRPHLAGRELSYRLALGGPRVKPSLVVNQAKGADFQTGPLAASECDSK